MLPVRTLRSLLPLALMAGIAGSIDAQILTYEVCLTGAQEVPAVVTPAIGNAQVILDVGTGTISVVGTYSGMSGAPTAAHIHGPAPIGVNGAIVLTLAGAGGTSGTLTGTGVISAPQIATMQIGQHYINMHSAAFPGGEIRGQIIQLIDSSCPAELIGDPVMLDNAGNPAIGPKIASATEGFDLAIDCTGAAGPSVYVIEMRTGKLGAAITTKFGNFYLTGQLIQKAVGAHTASVESFLGSPLTLPFDLSLPGLNYHAQGACGGFVPNARTTNLLTQYIGI